MRYLIFGDVHGNLPALEKMLNTEKGNYDSLISHGDVVNYGPWSNECVELLKELNCICLKGNHEEYFLNGAYPGDNTIVKHFFECAFADFSKSKIIAEYLDYYDLKNYRVTHTINNQYLFPDSDFSNIPIDNNYIIGHSHYQFQKEVKGFKILNTGSVGQNRKYINLVQYIVADIKENEIELKSLEYDVDVVISALKEKGYPQLCLNYYQQKERSYINDPLDFKKI